MTKVQEAIKKQLQIRLAAHTPQENLLSNLKSNLWKNFTEEEELQNL